MEGVAHIMDKCLALSVEMVVATPRTITYIHIYIYIYIYMVPPPHHQQIPMVSCCRYGLLDFRAAGDGFRAAEPASRA